MTVDRIAVISAEAHQDPSEPCSWRAGVEQLLRPVRSPIRTDDKRKNMACNP
jgi:hypothetical protein